MVSLITDGSSTDPQGKPFPRRRRAPWLIMVAVFAVLALFVWAKVLTRSESSATPITCNSPKAPTSAAPGSPTPPALGMRVGASRLQDVEPAALSATKVRVFNANGEHGQAAEVAQQLSDYGFPSSPVDNDPIYVDLNLDCYGQIRFGPTGRATAASLQLVAPCAELREDTRTDDGADLALGTVFREVAPNTDAEEVLRTLKDPSPGVAPAPLDLDLLAAARRAKC